MPILELRNLKKSYGPLQAVKGVSLQAEAGEVVALLGDNGAGKSTLAKMIAGAVTPDEGTIVAAGKEVRFGSPRDAEACGIEMVYQDLALIETLDVANNLYLGRETRRPGLLGRLGFIDKPRMRRESTDHFTELGTRLGSVRRPVEVLSGGQRQAVAIARASARAHSGGAGVVLMDEPLAALGVEQSQRVIELVQRLQERRILVILISHDLPLCFEIATRMVVMRHGQLVGDARPEDSSLEGMVALITGADEGTIRAR